MVKSNGNKNYALNTTGAGTRKITWGIIIDVTFKRW